MSELSKEEQIEKIKKAGEDRKAQVEKETRNELAPVMLANKLETEISTWIKLHPDLKLGSIFIDTEYGLVEVYARPRKQEEENV